MLYLKKKVIDMLTWRRLTIAVLLFLGLLGLTSVALVNGSTKEREQMNLKQGEVSQSIGIPPIDAAKSEQLETATFSLG
jgi:hypothetical protein